MPVANQMKSLAEDIEASYGARVSAVSDIIKETQASLGSFRRAHKKMASDLKDSLFTNNSGRVSEVRKMRAENIKELKEMAKNVSDFLASANSGRKDEVVKLTKEIRDFLGGLEKETDERINKVKALLSNFTQEHKETAAALRRELSSFQKNLSKTVGEMRTDFGSDHRQARTHWQNLAKVMAAKRTGKPVPTPKAEMGVPKAVKEEAEETFEKGEMKERVLKVIQAHPGGITLPEIGKALKVAYIRASKPLKELLMGMKVTKRDSEYFPA